VWRKRAEPFAAITLKISLMRGARAPWHGWCFLVFRSSTKQLELIEEPGGLFLT
jgi:hypothetical protein